MKLEFCLPQYNYYRPKKFGGIPFDARSGARIRSTVAFLGVNAESLIGKKLVSYPAQ